MGSQTVGYDWVTERAAHEKWERKKMMPSGGLLLKRSPVLMLTNFSISFPDSSLTSRHTFIDISPVFQVCLFREGTINFHESSFKFEDYFLNTVTEFRFCLMTFIKSIYWWQLNGFFLYLNTTSEVKKEFPLTFVSCSIWYLLESD